MAGESSPGPASLELGSLLREFRCRRRWRQLDLAAALNYSEPTVSRMESGQRALSSGDVEAIASVLQLSASESMALSAMAAAAALNSSGFGGGDLWCLGDSLGLVRDLTDRGLSYRLGLRHGEFLRFGESVSLLVDQQARFAGPSLRSHARVLVADLRFELAKAALEYYPKPLAASRASSLIASIGSSSDYELVLKYGMVREGILYMQGSHGRAVGLCRDLTEVGLSGGGYWESERARALLISTAEIGDVLGGDRSRLMVLADDTDDVAQRVFLLEGLAREAIMSGAQRAEAAISVLWAETERNLAVLMAKAPARLAQVLRTIALVGEDLVSGHDLMRRFVVERLVEDGNERYRSDVAG